MDKVIGVCLDEYGSDPEGYHLFDAKGQRIIASDWQVFLEAPGSSWVVLTAKIATRTPPTAPEVQEAVLLRKQERRRHRHWRNVSLSSRRTSRSTVPEAGLPGQPGQKTRDSDDGDADITSDSSDSSFPSGVNQSEDQSPGFSYPAIRPTDALAAETSPDEHDRLALVPYRRDRETEAYMFSRRSTGMSSGRQPHDFENQRRGVRDRSESPVNVVWHSRTNSGLPRKPMRRTKNELGLQIRRSQDDVRQEGKYFSLPPSRIPRYVLNSVPDVIVNKIIVPDTIQHIYFNPKASQKQNSAPETNNLPSKAASSTADILEGKLPKNAEGVGPSSTAIPLKIKHNNVPPVFFWSTNEHEEVSDSTGIRSTAIEDIEVFEAIVAQVDDELTKGKRFNTALQGEKRYPESKLYRNSSDMSRENIYISLDEQEREVIQTSGTQNSPKGLDNFSQKMRTLVDILDELSQFFIPAGSTCRIQRKYWGSVEALIEVCYDIPFGFILDSADIDEELLRITQSQLENRRQEIQSISR